MKPVLEHRRSGGGTVREVQEGLWRMEIPAGQSGVYRWAQLDDYLYRARRNFPWRLPQGGEISLSLRARVSAVGLPGTWGFGLWNDPFSASFGVGGAAARLPALPNTAWFFYAGEPNYLAFRDTHPASGLLAATFAAPRIPAPLLAPAALALPLLALRPTARLLRRAARLLIREDADLVSADPTEWHAYRIDWRAGQARFSVDSEHIFGTPVSPLGPLGLVIWIDNQYAAFLPTGQVRQGMSANPEPAWLEVDQVEVTGDAL